MLLTPTRLCLMVCTHMTPLYYESKRVTVPEMCEKFHINPRTLTPALTRLVKAKILNSRTGGTDRGYLLARDPKTISIYEIVHTIEGHIQMRGCNEIMGCTECFIAKGGSCLVHEELNKTLLYAKEHLQSISLYDQYSVGVESCKSEALVC